MDPAAVERPADEGRSEVPTCGESHDESAAGETRYGLGAHVFLAAHNNETERDEEGQGNPNCYWQQIDAADDGWGAVQGVRARAPFDQIEGAEWEEGVEPQERPEGQCGLTDEEEEYTG